MPMTLCLLLLAAAPVKMAVPGIAAADVDQRVADTLTEKFAVLAKRPGLDIVTARDIGLALGIERQKQLLGCANDDASCMAELAGALGAEVLLRGDLLHVGEKYTLVVKIIRARDGHEIASGTVRGTESDIEDWIEANAARLTDQVVEQQRGRPARAGPSWLRFAATAAAVAVAGTGALFVGLSYTTLGQLRSPSVMMSPRTSTWPVSSGQLQQALGWALLGTGAAIGVVAGVLFGLYEPGTQVSVGVMPGGAGATLRVALP